MSVMQTAAIKPLFRGDFPIPHQINYSLAALHISLNLFQLFILPLFLLPRNVWWGVCIIPIAALNNPFWALIHEAIHDLLSHNPRVNLALGRALSIVFGSPFHVLRLTHLSHHKFNRSPLEKGTEIYNPREVSRLAAGVKYYVYIVCGLYLLEVSSTLLFFLPANMFERMRKRVTEKGNAQEKWLANKFSDTKRLREIRVDGIAICLIFALSALCYQEHWRLLVGLLLARTLLISVMDNVYHYGTLLNVTISGHNLSLPRIFSALILHFNLHRVHHTHPQIPWNSLPEAFALQSDKFDRSLWTAVLQQFFGPVPLPNTIAMAASKKL
jgi:fatty acid desaturase